jgi:transposase
MARELTKKEIYERIKEWRNIKKLHQAARERVESQQITIKQLMEEVCILKERDKEKDAIIAAMKLQIEELKRMIFGRRSKKNRQDTDGEPPEDTPCKRPDRTPDSYQRRIPKDEAVTHIKHHGRDTCPDCGNHLENIQTAIFYEEDIVLPDTTDTPLKTTTKHNVERGWCKRCRAWKSGIPLPPSTVILGKKVRIYICYLSILIRLSYSQVRNLLATTYNFHISEGEIAYILEKEADHLRPACEALKDRIRAQRGAHYDETSYKVAKGAEGNYAWVMAGTETDEAVFTCGRSRGKGVAEELCGGAKHIGITDGYGVYKNMFSVHALCWSHPHRKLRDIAGSDALPEVDRVHCKSVFRDFSVLYAKMERVRKTPYERAKRHRAAMRLGREFDGTVASHINDPVHVSKIKAHLRENKACYFVCILEEGIPADNNKAERALRHLVIKRKTSFGSKTKRGAETVSILTSIILSLWWTKPENFFSSLLELSSP